MSGVTKTGMRGFLLSIIAWRCEVFFRELHHVHGECMQLEWFHQLEMLNLGGEIKEIIHEHSHLCDIVLTKTEPCYRDSAEVLI